MTPWILIGFFALVGAIMLYHHWPRSGAALFHHRYRDFDARCRARGLSHAQQTEEFLFRNAWAKLRRRSSAIVLASPSDPNKAIAKIAAEEAELLAVVNKQVAKKFIGVVNEAGLYEILYPDAYEAVEAWGKTNIPVAEITDDNIAALKTEA
jgi:hypothetical protein